MARPTTPQKTFLQKRLNGIYAIRYQCESGVWPAGIPQPVKTDLFTLERVGGLSTAPAWLFVSEAEFERAFEPHQGIYLSDTPEGGDKA